MKRLALFVLAALLFACNDGGDNNSQPEPSQYEILQKQYPEDVYTLDPTHLPTHIGRRF